MRNIALIQMFDTNDQLIREWSIGPTNNAVLSAKLDRRKGRRASSFDFTVQDKSFELANTLPLPYTREGSQTVVAVYVGTGRAGTRRFLGHLSRLKPSGMPGQLTIVANDCGRRARRQIESRSIFNSSAQEIIRRLADERGLTADFGGAAGLDAIAYTQVVQDGESNMDVIDRLASENGHTTFVRGTTLFVRKQGTAREGDQFVIEFGERGNVRNGFTFDIPELTRRTTPNVLDDDEALYQPPAGVEYEEGASDFETRVRRIGLNVQSDLTPSFTNQAVERAAQAQARASKVFKASIPLTVGAPEIDVDEAVIVRGFGDRFDGVWFVDGHTYDLKNDRSQLSLENGGAS